MSRLLKLLLFQVSNYDPLRYIGVSVLLCFVALIAILVPARRGMKIEPSVALRNE